LRKLLYVLRIVKLVNDHLEISFQIFALETLSRLNSSMKTLTRYSYSRSLKLYYPEYFLLYFASYYDKAGADELTFLDITASAEARNIMIDVVRRVAEQVFIPFTVGVE